MGQQEKSFAELRKIAANQQVQIKQDQELINQQHIDLENRARTIQNQRTMLEQEHARMIAENELTTRQIIEQSVKYALDTIPFWKFWLRWDINFLMHRADEIRYAITAKTEQVVREAKEKRQATVTSEVTTEILPEDRISNGYVQHEGDVDQAVHFSEPVEERQEA